MDRSDSYDYQQGERQPYPTGEVMTRRCTFYLSCYLLIYNLLSLITHCTDTSTMYLFDLESSGGFRIGSFSFSFSF